MSESYPDQIIIRTSKWATYQKACKAAQEKDAMFQQDGRSWSVKHVAWDDSARFDGRMCEIELIELVPIECC